MPQTALTLFGVENILVGNIFMAEQNHGTNWMIDWDNVQIYRKMGK